MTLETQARVLPRPLVLLNVNTGRSDVSKGKAATAPGATRNTCPVPLTCTLVTPELAELSMETLWMFWTHRS